MKNLKDMPQIPLKFNNEITFVCVISVEAELARLKERARRLLSGEFSPQAEEEAEKAIEEV